MKKIIILALIFLCSCSTRKVQTTEFKNQEHKENKEKTVDTTKIVKEAEKVSNVKVTSTTTDNGETVITTTTLEPVDNSKPASVTDETGKKTDLNNAKQTTTKKSVKKAKTEQTNTQSQTKEKGKETQENGLNKDISNTDDKKESGATRNSNRESIIPWWSWLILILIIAGVVIYKKYKNKITFFKK